MRKVILISLVVILTAFIYLVFLKEKETLKLGFIGGLSGRFAKLGNTSLNGIKLAFNEANNEVSNKKIILVPKDDKQNSQEAKTSMKELFNEKINFVFGSITSSMTKEALEIANERNMLLLSPTANSDTLSKIKDNLLRTQMVYDSNSFDILSKYLIKKNIKKIYNFYSDTHQSTANKYLIDFQNSFIKNGGEKFVKNVKLLNDYTKLINEDNKDNIDAVLIVASSVDAAKIVQFLRLGGFKKQIILSEWAYDDSFLENGGKSIEGALFLSSYNKNSSSKAYLDFVKKYQESYKQFPSRYAMQAYETANILIEVLNKDDEILNLKENILKQKTFKGLQGNIIFDEYGDVKRDYFLIHVKDNAFQNLNE